VFTGTAMMDASIAQALWPSFQRHLSSIKSTPGRHWAGMLQNSGTTIARLDHEPFWASLGRNPVNSGTALAVPYQPFGTL
jgi:hypothetical protein